MSEILINHVKRAACAVYGIALADIDRQDRRRRYAAARQMAMAVARDVTGQPQTVIGRAFADRDESTVRHAVEAVAVLLGASERERETYGEIERLARAYAGGRYAASPRLSRGADLDVVPDGEIRAMRDLPAMMIARRVGVSLSEVSRVLEAG